MTEQNSMLSMAAASAQAWGQTLSFQEALTSYNLNPLAIRVARPNSDQPRRLARGCRKWSFEMLNIRDSLRNDTGKRDPLGEVI
ncbi:MAG: hypothetical protein JNK63_01770 [Chthonomonas sp.]|nr:hypothetical protein [Chthonomonas sp.]